MTAGDPILERWIAETIESYPNAAIAFLAGEKDPFRNPVGHTLRRSLSVLYEQIRGQMDLGQIAPVLDAIVRIRAVQDLTPSQAVGFLFLLKRIVREIAPGEDQVLLRDRIDRLALMAFDKYMQCREQITEIRAKEGWYSNRLCQSGG